TMIEKRTDLALYRKLWRQAKLYRVHLVVLFGLSLLSSGLKLLAPLPLVLAVDSVVGSKPLAEPWNALITHVGGRFDTAILLLAAGLLVAIALLVQLVGLAINL